MNIIVMPKIDDSKYNILLAHSPIKIFNDDVLNELEELRKVNLILSGHMHNGMLPSIADKIIKNNNGIIAPNKSLLPDNARGIKTKNIDGKEMNLIISGGVTKIQETAPSIMHPFRNIYDSEVDKVKLLKR